MTLVLSVFLTSASAAVISSTVHDTIRDSFPADGFPNATHFDTIFVYEWLIGADTTEARGVIEFPISSLSSPVANATLNLFQSPSSDFLPNPTTINVYGYSGNNQVDFGDWAQATAPNQIGSFVYSNEATFDFDVTSFINAQINGSSSYAGLLLVWGSAPTSSGREKYFGEVSSPNYPTLTISTVPIPAGVWLFSSALGLMGWMRRKIARPGFTDKTY